MSIFAKNTKKGEQCPILQKNLVFMIHASETYTGCFYLAAEEDVIYIVVMINWWNILRALLNSLMPFGPKGQLNWNLEREALVRWKRYEMSPLL